MIEMINYSIMVSVCRNCFMAKDENNSLSNFRFSSLEIILTVSNYASDETE